MWLRARRRGALCAATALALFLLACRGGSSGGEAPRPSASQPIPVPARDAAAPPPASTYDAHPVPDGHAIEVRLTYAGKAPPAWKIPAAYASHCGGATEVPNPSFEVGPKGGVSGAVVWLDDLHEGEPPPTRDVVLDQKACVFAPHVLAAPAGAGLVLANDDPANHAVRLDFVGGPDDDSVVKMLAPGAKEVLPTTATWAGRVGRITCPIHPWMLAWVHFFDTPYFAVTRDGVARIEKVPSGTWHLSVWHEALDAKMGDTVAEGPPIRARFDVTVRDRDVTKTLTLRDDGSLR
jgi:hypothetical protein